MDKMNIVLTLLLVFCSNIRISVSVLEVTVSQGDNITLYCDCKLSTGVYIVWYRNCSHENQPTLVLKIKKNAQIVTTDGTDLVRPNFQFLRNFSSESYDLLILNITYSDEGIYYCGTEQLKVEDKEHITSKSIYNYGNATTRILLNTSPYSDSSECSSPSVYGLSWMMVAFTPAIIIFFSLLSFISVYHVCQKTDKESSGGVLHKSPDTTGQTSQNPDEDVYLTRVVFWVQDG